MARKRLKTTTATVEDKHDPYVFIEGRNKHGYAVFVYVWSGWGRYEQTHSKYFWYGRARAEAWGKRKLAKVKRIADHEKYSQRITIN